MWFTHVSFYLQYVPLSGVLFLWGRMFMNAPDLPEALSLYNPKAGMS